MGNVGKAASTHGEPRSDGAAGPAATKIDGTPRSHDTSRIACAKLLAKIAENFPLAPARGPPTSWDGLVQLHDDREAIQASPDDVPAIDIRSL